VYVGCSLDGFIAGEDDDLDWLGEPDPDGDDHGFADFLAQVGALLMGRRTYDVVEGFGGPWHYGERPVLVPTHRPLTPVNDHVVAVEGSIEELVERAKAAAGELDVYVDGGQVVRQALDAGLVDEITVTVVPMILGKGIPLFAGATQRHPLERVSAKSLSQGYVQLTYRPTRA
jgi:dihydrofolate reductase